MPKGPSADGWAAWSTARHRATCQAIHRGSFASVDELIAAIRAYIDAYNERCEPFTWTKTADEILDKLKHQTISATAHESPPVHRARVTAW